MTKLFSVVLPVSNQADHIYWLVDRYREALDKLPGPVELILVENASTDDTLRVCRRLEADHPAAVRVTRSEKGWARAVKSGLAAARGEVLCYTNSARTSPQDLFRCLLFATEYPEAVMKASRRVRDSWRRRLGSLLYNLECRALFDMACWDVNGTPKVFPRRFDALLALRRNDDLIDAEFAAVCRRRGYPIIEIPIVSTRRHGGQSTTSFWSALKMYWGAIQLWRDMRREPSGDEVPAPT